MKAVNWPDDLESVNDAFFNRANIQHCLSVAEQDVKINWTELDGNTISEKNNSILLKVNDITRSIVKKGGKGFFWIVVPQDLNSVFENTTSVKDGVYRSSSVEQMPLGYDCILFMGLFNKRWRIYQDPLLPPNTMLIGAGFSKKSKNYYAKVTLENFII